MVTKKTIQKIFAKLQLKPVDIIPISTGHYNELFLAYTEHGKFVLRIAPNENAPKLFYEKKMMHSEIEVHNKVLQNTDIPAPKIIAHDFSHAIIDRDYLIMSFLEGKPGLFRDRELGQYVRQLHNIKGDFFGYPDREAPIGHNWPEIFSIYFRLIFQDCLNCNIISKEEYDFFIKTYNNKSNVIKKCRSCLLHLDLWSQNILTKNNKITGILDFDRGLYGDPELEFAVLDTYGYSTDEFFRGYGIERPCDKPALIRRQIYLVYELIKYAFIRMARNKNRYTARQYAEECKQLLRRIN
jgi:fructosamine-3-kinase